MKSDDKNKIKDLKLSPAEIELQNQALEKIRKGLVGKKGKLIKTDLTSNKDKKS